MMIRKISILLLLLHSLLCGCVKLDSSLVIREDGSCKESVRIKAPTPLSSVMSEQYKKELGQFNSEGYTAKIEKSDAGAVLEISKEFKDRSSFINAKHFDPLSGRFVKRELNLSITSLNFLLYKQISFRQVLARDKEQDYTHSVIAGTLEKTRSVTFPFPITSSNADKVISEKNTAVWNLSELSDDETRELSAVASEWNYPVLLIFSSFLLVLIIILGKKILPGN